MKKKRRIENRIIAVILCMAILFSQVNIADAADLNPSGTNTSQVALSDETNISNGEASTESTVSDDINGTTESESKISEETSENSQNNESESSGGNVKAESTDNIDAYYKDTITKCYKQLANKKNLIQEIVMSPETLDMQYLDEKGNEVSKESLSAGEKQLMVIAILWALALCSKKKLPVIIDTPLSRLDSQHRTSIINTYFPNASDQTIILSTDTEIDQNYYEMMKNSVGDEFTLVYNEETKSTSIKKGYFQEL